MFDGYYGVGGKRGVNVHGDGAKKLTQLIAIFLRHLPSCVTLSLGGEPILDREVGV